MNTTEVLKQKLEVYSTYREKGNKWLELFKDYLNSNFFNETEKVSIENSTLKFRLFGVDILTKLNIGLDRSLRFSNGRIIANTFIREQNGFLSDVELILFEFDTIGNIDFNNESLDPNEFPERFLESIVIAINKSNVVIPLN